jgi:hypothetical protein
MLATTKNKFLKANAKRYESIAIPFKRINTSNKEGLTLVNIELINGKDYAIKR